VFLFAVGARRCASGSSRRKDLETKLYRCSKCVFDVRCVWELGIVGSGEVHYNSLNGFCYRNSFLAAFICHHFPVNVSFDDKC
jgi:hypothetical protein